MICGYIININWGDAPTWVAAIAEYNEYEAEISIKTLNVKSGKLPAKVLGLVLEWAEQHQDELLRNWNSLQTTGDFVKIEPLI